MKSLRPLIILNRRPTYNIALHGQFLEACRLLGIEPAFYGPRTAGVEQFKAFDPNGRISDIVSEHQANCVIFYRACWTDLRWLPFAEFHQIVPTVLIDVDFYKYRRHQDLIHQAVDLHLLRHPADLPFSKNNTKDVLPLSVDPSTYARGDVKGREGICFSGAMKNTLYLTRQMAVRMLVADVPKKKLSLSDQAAFYNRHLAALTCCGGWTKYLVGKNFEIAATGTVLFTAGDSGIENYLPKETYVRFSMDCKDLHGKWAEVQKYRELWLDKAIVASRHVHTHHSHVQRWLDLLALLNQHLNMDVVANFPIRKQMGRTESPPRLP